MDYRIEDKAAFTVVGTIIGTTCQEGENSLAIPKFWRECHQDGIVDKLSALGAGEDMLGIIMDTQQGKDEFNYMIGVKYGGALPGDGFIQRTIPASTWAIFSSIGPMPGAIQDVFNRIYQEWFPSTGYEHAGTPEMEVYPLGDTTADNYRCEVWVPIVKE